MKMSLEHSDTLVSNAGTLVENPRGVEQTLADLVRIDSRSSLTNREVIMYAATRLEADGFRIQHFPYTDERGVEKLNMVAVTPHVVLGAEVIELALVGHTDTVPFDPTWTEALTLNARDGKLFGRGACDTKGFIAAALAAVEGVNLATLVRPLAVVLTADEEVGCLGAKRLADARSFTARYSIVGEPTSLQPIRAGKGYCLAEVSIRGREGHSAYPALGASAIFRAARLISRIEALAEKLKLMETHSAFDPPHTTINVGLINGGTAKNVLAGECRFTLEWRPVPNQHPEHVINLIKREVESLRDDDGYDCEIDVIRLDGGTETRTDSVLVRALEDATGKPAGAVAFGTEAPQMAALGAEPVVFGPGDIRVAHRTGEFVPVDELQQCVTVLKTMIERFCAGGK